MKKILFFFCLGIAAITLTNSCNPSRPDIINPIPPNPNHKTETEQEDEKEYLYRIEIENIFDLGVEFKNNCLLGTSQKNPLKKVEILGSIPFENVSVIPQFPYASFKSDEIKLSKNEIIEFSSPILLFSLAVGYIKENDNQKIKTKVKIYRDGSLFKEGDFLIERSISILSIGRDVLMLI